MKPVRPDIGFARTEDTVNMKTWNRTWDRIRKSIRENHRLRTMKRLIYSKIRGRF